LSGVTLLSEDNYPRFAETYLSGPNPTRYPPVSETDIPDGPEYRSLRRLIALHKGEHFEMDVDDGDEWVMFEDGVGVWNPGDVGLNLDQEDDMNAELDLGQLNIEGQI